MWCSLVFVFFVVPLSFGEAGLLRTGLSDSGIFAAAFLFCVFSHRPWEKLPTYQSHPIFHPMLLEITTWDSSRMTLAFDKIKRDFARHKKKTGILSVLAVVMFGFIW